MGGGFCLAAKRLHDLDLSAWHYVWMVFLPATFNGFGAAWVQIDEPKFRFSIRQNYLPNVTSFYYMRLHGRNAAQWWRHEKSEDRYNYLYSADELREFSTIAGAAKTLVKKSYLYTNNHFAGNAVANAAQVRSRLGDPVRAPFPRAFLERFPQLEGIVRADGLF